MIEEKFLSIPMSLPRFKTASASSSFCRLLGRDHKAQGTANLGVFLVRAVPLDLRPNGQLLRLDTIITDNFGKQNSARLPVNDMEFPEGFLVCRYEILLSEISVMNGRFMAHAHFMGPKGRVNVSGKQLPI